jgi:hypothetical protein
MVDNMGANDRCNPKLAHFRQCRAPQIVGRPMR